MSGRDQTMHAKERALWARFLRYKDLTYREIGKQLFGVSRVRAFQVVAVGIQIEERQAAIAAKRIRKEKNRDLAIEACRMRGRGLSDQTIAERLEIPAGEIDRMAKEGIQIANVRAAHGSF